MVTIKSYTDIEQSKKLAKILPIESADLCYIAHSELINIHEPFYKKLDKEDLPCWSLSALFSVIPQEIFDGEYVINITEGRDKKWVISYDYIRNENFCDLSLSASNLVDACYEMIIRLHESNLL